MPFNRPREVDGNQFNGGRRIFRSPLEFKRPASSNKQNGRSMKQAPPEQTNAENFYYLKQMNAKTPMVVVLTDGEQIRGCIEWYDRSSIKVNRDGAPNLLIQKHCIKYIYKQEEE